jgi:methylmalonyl-CoA/ethylmalonyl-CoA epimerase
VTELRVAMTVADFDTALAFYRDALGLEVLADWSGEQGRCIALAAGRATLELFDERQAAFVDDTEVGRRVSGPIRFAFEVADAQRTTAVLEAAGAHVEAPAAPTPWGDVNARVRAPDGMQLTLFSVPQA